MVQNAMKNMLYTCSDITITNHSIEQLGIWFSNLSFSYWIQEIRNEDFYAKFYQVKIGFFTKMFLRACTPSYTNNELET